LGFWLLNFLLLNCTWESAELQATFKHPFDLMIESREAHEQKRAAGVASNGFFENRRGMIDLNDFSAV
jgi:hypothetical protein